MISMEISVTMALKNPSMSKNRSFLQQILGGVVQIFSSASLLNSRQQVISLDLAHGFWKMILTLNGNSSIRR